MFILNPYILLDIDILHLDHGPNNSDPFITRMLMTDDQGRFSQIYVDRTMLFNMHWREVIVKRWPYPLKFQYYRSLIADVHIQLCLSCNQVSSQHSLIQLPLSPLDVLC